MSDDDKLITAEQLAAALGRTRRWLYDSQEMLNIPRYRLGGETGRGHYRYRPSEIEAWLNGRRVDQLDSVDALESR